MEITTIRKDRTNLVTGARIAGPTHRINFDNQTWCGRKINGLAAWHIASMDDLTCEACIKAVAKDRPRAWKSR